MSEPRTEAGRKFLEILLIQARHVSLADELTEMPDEDTLAGKAVLLAIFASIVLFALFCGTVWMVPE